MDSANWSDKQKADAARSFSRRVGSLFKDPIFRAKRRRNEVAADLSAAVALSGMTRSKVAEKAGMKAAQLTKQLDGSTNLTLDSIGRICEAVGYDFDVVLRKPTQPVVRQPWARGMDRTTLVQLVWNHSLDLDQPATYHQTCLERPSGEEAANQNKNGELLAA